MADAAPYRLLTSVATTGVRSTARPARKMGDSRGQVSWLAAQTSPLAFPEPPKRSSGILESGLTAYSCGGSHGFNAFALHRVPFSLAKRTTWENQRMLSCCANLMIVNLSWCLEMKKPTPTCRSEGQSVRGPIDSMCA